MALMADNACHGIRTVGQLRRAHQECFVRLCCEQRAQDICVPGQLHCEAARAHTPYLPKNQRHVFWRTRQRRAGNLPQHFPVEEDS